MRLLRVLSELRPQGAAWPGMLDTWRADVRTWRGATAAELGAAGEDADQGEDE
jgi:hypothetical protein